MPGPHSRGGTSSRETFFVAKKVRTKKKGRQKKSKIRDPPSDKQSRERAGVLAKIHVQIRFWLQETGGWMVTFLR